MDAEDATNEDAMDTGLIGIMEPSADDFIGELLLQQLGPSGRSYKREQRAACSRIVSEMYSPPIVTAEIKRMKHKHLLPGFALDLTVVDPEDSEPWDFSLPHKRDKARAMRRRQRPYMLIGSPECTQFSTLQAINVARSRDPSLYRRAKARAILHINSMAELYREQMEDGHYFLHEHPRWATSWTLPEIEKLLQVPSVGLVRCDQCQYGAEAQRGAEKGSPILKPTGFMSNSEAVLGELSRRCDAAGGYCSRPSRTCTVSSSLS